MIKREALPIASWGNLKAKPQEQRVIILPDEILITLTVDIVSSHVSYNNVSIEDTPKLILSVYASLADLGKPASTVPDKREPAASIRASVKSDALICLECGMKMKMLKRHLGTNHSMTPAKYRSYWGLPSDYPMVAPEYAARRKELALKIGLGRKAKAPVSQVKLAIDGSAKPKRVIRKKTAASSKT